MAVDRGLQKKRASLASRGDTDMSPAARAAARAGFTLLEVMIALLLLAGAFLAVAQLLAVAGRASDRARGTALGAVLAAQKMEQLRALSWAFDIDGTPLDGLSLSPAGALTADAAGFVDYFDDSGAPLGGGPPPSARAVFARRWSVEHASGMAPPTALILRVAVLRRGPPGPASGRGAPGWTEVARMIGAKARRPS
jgi:prepilin-type N-terminal cleavage/methylation domain-containing protein